MSGARAWLSGRRPTPPEEMAEALADERPEEAPMHEALSARALAALERARGVPGPVRASAFELLAADAFLTYACEAALEASDPAGVLEGLVRSAAEE